MNREFDDDDDLVEPHHGSDEIDLPQNMAALLGWVKYKFSDMVSGIIVPWDTDEPIADAWDKKGNSIHFYNQSGARVKIGSLVVCSFNRSGMLKKLNNKFLIWQRSNNEAFLMTMGALIKVNKSSEEFQKGIRYVMVRWNYSANYLMIHPDNKEVKEKDFLNVLNILWSSVVYDNKDHVSDMSCLVSQMKSHLTYADVGRLFHKSLEEVLNGDLSNTIAVLRKIKDWNLERIVWNWGGITMSPVNFARWLTGIDDSQPLIKTQAHVEVWKHCLKNIPYAELICALGLLKDQKAPIKQIFAVEQFIARGGWAGPA